VLPAAPDFMSPVISPEIRKGMDARALAARLAGSLDAANDRLSASRVWYTDVTKRCSVP
jgi:hypothetical protein